MTLPKRRAMVSFCTQFLSLKRVHIYRQVCGVQDFENWVVTRRLYNRHQLPYDRIYVLKKSPFRFLPRLWRYPRRAKLLPLDRFELKQLLDFARAKDAVLIHTYFGTDAARLLPYFELETRPKVVSFLGLDVTEHALPAAELERLCATVDLFLCFSRSLADVLRGRGCPPERIRVNPPGVPVPEGNLDRDAPELSSERPLRLLQACRFVQKKGLDVSILCLAILQKKRIPARLTLAGEGPERASLEALVRDVHVLDSVRFAGFLDSNALAHEMQQHDVFLHPSRTTATGDLEGIPSVILEAMAHGLPVISTPHGGIPEVITGERDGCLIPETRPELLADAVLRVVYDASFYNTLSRQARARVKADFSIDASVRKLQEHYREAIQIGRTRSQTARSAFP